MRNVLRTPGPEQVQCQKPKPILLDTGEMKTPYDWAVSGSIICFLKTDFYLKLFMFEKSLEVVRRFVELIIQRIKV